MQSEPKTQEKTQEIDPKQVGITHYPTVLWFGLHQLWSANTLSYV